MKMFSTKMMVLAVGLALFAGCVTEQPPQPKPVTPPPLQAELISPSPDPSYSWTPGCWDWKGHWVWMRGHWAPRRAGAFWMPGAWVHQGDGYVWIHSHWQ